ncbi:MAG: T9SS type A sorting domain-containing protein [Bacteroidetes bacterium]|nr:T9SS type A sorting domain-containing protein [Bacteroidota bacterium]
MKKLSLLFLAVLCCVSAASQVDSVTYGISVAAQGSGIYLSRINVTDGTVSKISADAVVQVPGGHGRTIDPLHHVYYYAADSALLAFDLKTGELIRKISVTNYLNSTFLGISYNYIDSTLYGIAADAAGPNIKLAKIDPYSGLVTPISDSSLATSYNVLTGTALDPVHGIFYFVTLKDPPNHLIAADLRSGNLISDLPIGIDPGDRFGPMEYNCRDSALYGLTGSYAHWRKLARINPQNGTVTVLSTYPVADTILNEQVTIDPFQQVFYFEAKDHTYRGVSLNSGDLVTAPNITPLPGSYFSGFIFNHTCYYHSSSFIGENKTDPELTIFPNPVSGRLNIRSKKPILTVEIIDFTGKSILAADCHGLKEFQADLTGFPEGIYIVRVNNERTSASSKFVKTDPGMKFGH